MLKYILILLIYPMFLVAELDENPAYEDYRFYMVIEIEKNYSLMYFCLQEAEDLSSQIKQESVKDFIEGAIKGVVASLPTRSIKAVAITALISGMLDASCNWTRTQVLIFNYITKAKQYAEIADRKQVWLWEN